jgi:hypothetical protein
MTTQILRAHSGISCKLFTNSCYFIIHIYFVVKSLIYVHLPFELTSRTKLINKPSGHLLSITAISLLLFFLIKTSFDFYRKIITILHVKRYAGRNM